VPDLNRFIFLKFFSQKSPSHVVLEDLPFSRQVEDLPFSRQVKDLPFSRQTAFRT